MNQDKLEELVSVQREMLKWIRFTSLPQLKRTLESVLATAQDKSIYEMTDGRATSRSIAATLNVGKTTVIRKWMAWAQIGIVEQLDSGGYIRLCSLTEVGIDVPQGVRADAVPVQDSEEGI